MNTRIIASRPGTGASKSNGFRRGCTSFVNLREAWQPEWGKGRYWNTGVTRDVVPCFRGMKGGKGRNSEGTNNELAVAYLANS